MIKFPKNEYRAVEPVRSRIKKLNNYMLSEHNLTQRVHVGLAVLRDALLLWNRALGRPFFHFGDVIDQSKLNNCRVFNHRSTLLESLSPCRSSMEIGVLVGEFSLEIVRALEPDRHVMIDVDTEIIDRSLFSDLNVEIEIVQGKSSEILPNYLGNNFDFVYIDGAHDEKSVTIDLENAQRLLSPDGIIMLNDYCLWSPNQAVEYGVLHAVNGFLNQTDFEMIAIAIDSTGSYDVALRRSAG